jgi:ATP-dependent DNA helicase RecG
MAAPSLMNCLLLGDVGSGKTAVALHAVAAAVDSGRQAAMIAPTTVLAEQYAVKLGPLLDSQGVSWALLTGSCKPSQREEASAGLANGSSSVAFGTHALLEQDVSFASLSLAVIDEQHRFGVEQRERIRTKSRGLDVLMMSATPIPRSLAMVVYGDMSTVYLRSRPNAAKVQTRILHHELLFEAYDAIRQAMAAGQQAYIICPLIEPGGKAAQKGGKGKGEGAPDEQQKESDIVSLYSEFDDSPHIAAAVEEVRMLGEQVFSDRRVELMTSRLSDAEKHDVMQAFRAGETDILVSTTVVEVGIDVPNATVMVIMDADRFGLAQLHQLRGRVGRGRSDGQVFLVTQNKEPDALARLRALEATSDGLELAQMDLRLRREGDILGTRQHGRGALKLVNVVRDAALIEAAHEDAAALLEADPELALPVHRFLASECARMLQEGD